MKESSSHSTPLQQDSASSANFLAPTLGWWNLYFLIKLALFYQGRIGFHALENLSLAALLLIPIRRRWLNRLRHIFALVPAFWLFHHDSFLPPLGRLTAQMDQLLAFEPAYLLELLLRFVPVNAVLSLAVLLFAYYLFSKVFRVSVVVSLALVVTAFNSYQPVETVTTPLPVATTNSNPTATTGDDSHLNQYLKNFFSREQERQVQLSAPAANQNFDILLLSVCSLSWDDLAVTGLAEHPFMQGFDIVFDRFNSATSYSGPALLRLTSASCGQPSHRALYQDTPPQCRLFENLSQLGYDEALMMNHDGEFNSLLERTRQFGGIDAPLFPQTGLVATQKAFAGSPVYSDLELLSRWWQSRQQQPPQSKPVVALYNSATLHDGNRILNHKPVFGVESYRIRAQILFDELQRFFKLLEQSGRDIVVVLVPEHGGGLRGDKMQISGMREIPSPSITHIPVGVRFFGQGLTRQGGTAHVPQPTSHMALSQLIDNIIEQNVYGSRRLNTLDVARGLPETAKVSQNEGSTVIEVDGNHYISLDNQSWSSYPAQ